MGDWQRAGVVVELSEATLKTTKVPTAVLSGGEATGSLLPPEPTLKDLASLGSLQDKVRALENSFSQLQDELKNQENEIASLKSELAHKIEAAETLKAELTKAQEEGRTAALAQSEQAKTLEELRTRIAELEEAQQELRREKEKAASTAPAEAAPAMAPAAEPPMSAVPSFTATQEPRFQELGSPIEGLPNTQVGPALEMTPLAAAEIPIAATPLPSPELGGLQSLGTSIPETGPISAGPLPLSPPFPSVEPPKAEKKTLEEPTPDFMDLSVSGARKTKRKKIFRSLFKTLFFLVILGGGLAAGVAYNLGYLDKNGVRALIAQARQLARSQLGQPLESQTSPLEVAQGRTTPKNPLEIEGGIPDRTQEAIEIVKSYALPGGQTLGVSLEGPGQQPGLSPWMVEKRDENRYQVNFYARKKGKGAKKPKYEFEVQLAEKSVHGLNAKSQAVLESGPKTPSKRARRKETLLDESFGDSLVPSSGETAPEQAREPQQESMPEKAPETSAPAPSPEAAPAAEKPSHKPRRKVREPSLDELLLPGVPKSGGGNTNKDLEKLINSE